MRTAFPRRKPRPWHRKSVRPLELHVLRSDGAAVTETRTVPGLGTTRSRQPLALPVFRAAESVSQQLGQVERIVVVVPRFGAWLRRWRKTVLRLGLRVTRTDDPGDVVTDAVTGRPVLDQDGNTRPAVLYCTLATTTPDQVEQLRMLFTVQTVRERPASALTGDYHLRPRMPY